MWELPQRQNLAISDDDSGTLDWALSGAAVVGRQLMSSGACAGVELAKGTTYIGSTSLFTNYMHLRVFYSFIFAIHTMN
jgi:hypothetical protein